MRIALLVLFLAAVGCKSTSAPYRDAMEANTSTAVALGSTGAVLEVGARQLTTLGKYVMEAGKGYYASVVDLWEQARDRNARAEFANAVQKQKVDGLEAARVGWERQYTDLRGDWFVIAALWFKRAFIWLSIAWVVSGVAGVVLTVLFPGSTLLLGIGRHLLAFIPFANGFTQMARAIGIENGQVKP